VYYDDLFIKRLMLLEILLKAVSIRAFIAGSGGFRRKTFKEWTQTWSLALANTMMLDASPRSVVH
jgi:hypothetical protein